MDKLLLFLAVSRLALPMLLLPPDGLRPGHEDGFFSFARVTCKQVSSCEEAVAIWCNGYSRADGDSDGIPCENVCHSVEQVEEIKARQGC